MSNKKLNEAKIAISGKSGCGNTTVCGLVAEALGIRIVNFTFRNLAEEKGMDLKQVLDLAKDDDSWDKELDTRQTEMAREEGGCVLGSRLAIWMLKDADLKVFLTASDMVRAGRIHNREGGSLQEIADFTAGRDRQDSARYKRIYDIDNNDYSSADLIIDTDDKDPHRITEIIIGELKKKLG